MKKSLIIIALLSGLFLLNLQTVNAQESLNIGIRGGINFATLAGSNLPDTFDPGSRTGIMLGIYASLPISNSPVTIQPEFLYSQKGFTLEYTIGEDDETTTQITEKYNYLEVPLLIKFSLPVSGPVSPHLYFGPYGGIKLNGNYEDNGTISLKNNFDFGGMIGAGIGFDLLNVGLRYQRGLTNSFKLAGFTSKNSVFSIVAGIEIE